MLILCSLSFHRQQSNINILVLWFSNYTLVLYMDASSLVNDMCLEELLLLLIIIFLPEMQKQSPTGTNVLYINVLS